MDIEFKIKKNEIFFITSGSYSDKSYCVFQALQDIDNSTIEPIKDFCENHEFNHDYLTRIEPLHFMVMLENQGIVKRVKINNELNMDYVIGSVCQYECDYLNDEYKEAQEKIKSCAIVPKTED